MSVSKILGMIMAYTLVLGTFVFIAGLLWYAIRWAWAA